MCAAQRTQRGTSLVEALVASLVLSLGLIGIARLQMHLRLAADIARQRSEAVHLAREDLETLRSFSTMDATSSGRSYAEVAPAASDIGPASGYSSNTTYRLTRSVAGAHGYRAVDTAVDWDDRSGQPQRVVLHSAVAAIAPALSGALSARAVAQPLKTVRGRSAFIPSVAKDLGNGTSALRSNEAGSVAFVFDNITGRISARCTEVPATTPTRDLVSSDLGGCTAASGLLLAGVVRLSLATPPDPARANDTPLPLSVALRLDGPAAATPPECASEAQKTVAIATAAGTQRESVPIAATPATFGVASWVDLGERFVAYHCVVTPVEGVWSGRSTVQARGWRIGLAPTEFRVCRYSADQDGSGRIDRNSEHPDAYSDVDRTLMQQNFLIVRGDQACPAAPADGARDASGAVHVDLSTVQHQP
ncbi:MAG TPA: hypothetical protein VJ743_19515 [Albitalea sp.]|nr:hypothetical protein [Albitalea sp.]